MTLFDIVEQLKASGYDISRLDGRQIIVTSKLRLKASLNFTRDMFLYTDMLVVDGVIYKDRTGQLEGERATMEDLICSIQSCGKER